MAQLPGDNEILELLGSDPERGFPLLQAKYNHFRFVDKLVREAKLPESYIDDVKSEMLIALYQNVVNGRLRVLKAKFSTYLYVIAKNLVVSKIRALGRENKLPPPDMEVEGVVLEWKDWPDEPLDAYEQQVKKCLDNMPPECRKLLRLRYGSSLDYERLKEILGFASKEVAKQRAYKCREQLKQCVKQIAAMDRDEDALLELLRRFLDNELPPAEKTELEDRLRTDNRLRELLEEEQALQRALGKISRVEIAALARKTVGASSQTRRFSGIFPMPRYGRIMAAAAAILGLVAGALWLLGPDKPGHPSIGSQWDHTTTFEAELPVLIGRRHPAPSGQTLSVTLAETRTSSPSYTLEGGELRIETPAGFWPEPIKEVRVFKMEDQPGILLQLNGRFYPLPPAPLQKPLPTPVREE